MGDRHLNGVADQRVVETKFNRFTMEPPFVRVTLTNTNTGPRVTLTCKYIGPTSSDEVELISIDIQKCLRGTMTSLIRADSTGTENVLSWPDSKLDFKGSTRFSSQLSFVWTSCQDEALYGCRMNVRNKTGHRRDIISYNDLYLSVNGPVTLTVGPEGKSSWNVDDDVALTCIGPAPKNETHRKKWTIDFVWDFRDPGKDAWYPVDSSTVNLTEDTAPAFANNTGTYCGRIVSEVKKIRLREEDLGWEFRCYMVVNGDGYLKYKASVTLGMISTEGGGDKGGDDKGGVDKAGGDKAGVDKAGGDKAEGDKAGGDKAGGDKGGDDKGGDDKGVDFSRFQSKSDDHSSPILIGEMGAGGGLLLLGVGALACFLKRRRHQQLADTARQGPTSRDRDHGEVSHPTADNDLNEPDETAGSDVSGSSSDSTSEEPSTYSGTSDVAGN